MSFATVLLALVRHPIKCAHLFGLNNAIWNVKEDIHTLGEAGDRTLHLKELEGKRDALELELFP